MLIVFISFHLPVGLRQEQIEPCGSDVSTSFTDMLQVIISEGGTDIYVRPPYKQIIPLEIIPKVIF